MVAYNITGFFKMQVSYMLILTLPIYSTFLSKHLCPDISLWDVLS